MWDRDLSCMALKWVVLHVQDNHRLYNPSPIIQSCLMSRESRLQFLTLIAMTYIRYDYSCLSLCSPYFICNKTLSEWVSEWLLYQKETQTRSNRCNSYHFIRNAAVLHLGFTCLYCIPLYSSLCQRPVGIDHNPAMSCFPGYKKWVWPPCCADE